MNTFKLGWRWSIVSMEKCTQTTHEYIIKAYMWHCRTSSNNIHIHVLVHICIYINELFYYQSTDDYHSQPYIRNYSVMYIMCKYSTTKQDQTNYKRNAYFNPYTLPHIEWNSCATDTCKYIPQTKYPPVANPESEQRGGPTAQGRRQWYGCYGHGRTDF